MPDAPQVQLPVGAGLCFAARTANFRTVVSSLAGATQLPQFQHCTLNKLCGRPPQYTPAPCKLTFDLLTLEVVSESRVTWATFVPISVPLGLSVLDLGPMYASDRQTDRQTPDAHHRLMPPTVGAGA